MLQADFPIRETIPHRHLKASCTAGLRSNAPKKGSKQRTWCSTEVHRVCFVFLALMAPAVANKKNRKAGIPCLVSGHRGCKQSQQCCGVRPRSGLWAFRWREKDRIHTYTHIHAHTKKIPTCYFPPHPRTDKYPDQTCTDQRLS